MVLNWLEVHRSEVNGRLFDSVDFLYKPCVILKSMAECWTLLRFYRQTLCFRYGTELTGSPQTWSKWQVIWQCGLSAQTLCYRYGIGLNESPGIWSQWKNIEHFWDSTTNVLSTWSIKVKQLNNEIQTHVSSSDMALDCTNLPDVL